MTADIPDPIDRELESHEAFTAVDEGYTLETTVFDTLVTADEAEGKRDGTFHVTVFLPSLDAAVADDAVAPVVEDGWFETLERRLADVFSVAHTSTHDEPAFERDPSEVRVILEYVSWDAREGVDDAKTLIEYVEGTYAQGIIPGYEYRGAAKQLVNDAMSRGEGAANGDGTPM